MRAVERVGRGDRDAVLLGCLDDVVIGADLRRRHDQAVDGRILDDLVEDFDFARRVVDRRFRAEQQDLRADQVAGDRGADIDRIEEAVAGGVGDDARRSVAPSSNGSSWCPAPPWRRRRSCSRRPPWRHFQSGHMRRTRREPLRNRAPALQEISAWRFLPFTTVRIVSAHSLAPVQ